MKSLSLVMIVFLKSGLLPKAGVHVLQGLPLEPRGALNMMEPQTLTFPPKVLRALSSRPRQILLPPFWLAKLEPAGWSCSLLRSLTH